MNPDAQCPNCEAPLQAKSAFCARCGAKLDVPTAQQADCSSVSAVALIEDLPKLTEAQYLWRGLLILVSVIASWALTSRFVATGLGEWRIGIAAAIALSFVSAELFAAMRVTARGSDRRAWPAWPDVCQALPVSVLLVALPLGLTLLFIKPLFPAHRSVLGLRAAIVLSGLPLCMCLVFSAFALAYFAASDNWRQALTRAGLWETVARCGIAEIAVGLVAFIAIVCFLPLVVANAVYACWRFMGNEGAVAEHEHGGGPLGLGQAIALWSSRSAFERWVTSQDEDAVGPVAHLRGLLVTFTLALPATLLALPYCYVVVLGRLAGCACMGRKIRFWAPGPPWSSSHEERSREWALA